MTLPSTFSPSDPRYNLASLRTAIEVMLAVAEDSESLVWERRAAGDILDIRVTDHKGRAWGLQSRLDAHACFTEEENAAVTERTLLLAILRGVTGLAAKRSGFVG